MKLVTLLSIILLVAIPVILYPLFVEAKPTSHRTACLSKVKQLATGTMMYTEDSDGRFPDRDFWVDATTPYVREGDLYHCPEAVGSSWGYAYNGALDRAKPKGDLSLIPLFYDSVNLTKNASDLVTSLPLRPRHRFNCISYADGHAKTIGTGGRP